MNDPTTRRPLNSRNTGWAHRIAGMLAARDIAANRISQASMGAALIAGAAFWMTARTGDPLVTAGLLILAALACQLRLLCNLFDGMVAIEAGKGAPDGPFWNEVPDRVSDILILVGVGLGIGAPALGFAAATMAVLTAYVREFGAGLGLAPNFCGPMAKPHRMALITGAAVLATLEPLMLEKGTLLGVALWIVVLGGLATALRRADAIRKSLLGGRRS